MTSPAKKRKLNNGGNTGSPAKGLEYFFSKQRQNETAPVSEGVEDKSELLTGNDGKGSLEMTDEELARKLQAEWDKEAAESTGDATTAQENITSTSKLRPADGPGLAAPDVSQASASAQRPQKNKTLTLQSAGNADDIITSSIPLDESPLTFDASKYVAELQKHWASEDGNASYALLTRCFVLASATTSRIKIVDTMTNCLRILIEGDPSSLLPAVSSEPVLAASAADLLRFGWQQTRYHRHTFLLNSASEALPSQKP
jgi:DNA ligase-1